MFADSPNVGILAAAGSRKTQQIIDTALGTDGRVLVTTYTNENLKQIRRRIEQVRGTVPANIHLTTWFSFLISHGVRPYQSSVLGQTHLVRGLNFDGNHPDFTKRERAVRYYTDPSGNVYRKHLADLAVAANTESNGAVIRRIARIYDAVLLDELQDMAGWDLQFIDLLLEADLNLLMVGDPRQHTYSTYPSNKNRKYRGMGIVAWLAERADVCHRLDRTESFRCHQTICDFADALYPEMPTTTSVDVPNSGHDGVVLLNRDEVAEYYAEYEPVVLRARRDRDTMGWQAINIGVSKGSTYDRVLIFPTNPMKEYVTTGNLGALKARASFYVAVTRARFSVAIVVD